MGAMVESAPTEMKRLPPTAAKAIEPAANAIRPVSAGIPARRAVANCPGKAIATSIRPAMASRISHDSS